MPYVSRAPRPATPGSDGRWCYTAPPLGHEWMGPAGPCGVASRRCLCEAVGGDGGYMALKGIEVNITKKRRDKL